MNMYNECGNCRNNGLLLEIQKISFAMDELRLYIDTHPSNDEAIALFNEYAIKRKELVEKYNTEIAPLGGYDAECGNEWRWGRGTAAKGGEY